MVYDRTTTCRVTQEGSYLLLFQVALPQGKDKKPIPRHMKTLQEL